MGLGDWFTLAQLFPGRPSGFWPLLMASAQISARGAAGHVGHSGGGGGGPWSLWLTHHLLRVGKAEIAGGRAAQVQESVSFLHVHYLQARTTEPACKFQTTLLEADLIEYSWTLMGCRPHESHDLHLLLWRYFMRVIFPPLLCATFSPSSKIIHLRATCTAVAYQNCAQASTWERKLIYISDTDDSDGST